MDLESARRFGQQRLDILRSYEQRSQLLGEAILAHGAAEESSLGQVERADRLRGRYRAVAEIITSSFKGNRHTRSDDKAITYHESTTVPMDEDAPDGDRLGVELSAEFTEFGSEGRKTPKYIKVSWYVLPKTLGKDQPAIPLDTQEVWSYQVGLINRLDQQERVVGLLERSVGVLAGEPVAAST